MKLFSNFDTKKKKKTLERYQKEFGKDNVLIIQKSKLFWFLKVFTPFLGYLLSELVVVLFSVKYISHKYFLYFIIGMSILIFIVFARPILTNYLQYKMDFLIITPKEIVKYDQEGFFEKDVKTMNVINLKTISVKKKGILNSIFDNGDMIFLSEGIVGDIIGEIIFHYVHGPNKIRHKISSIIKGN